LFAEQFFTWASSNNIPILYFEAFDESFKAVAEGPQGAHWGIFDTTAVIKPGMDAFFNGQTSPVNCNDTIPGPVGIAPVYVPPYGSGDTLEVQVTGVQPANYKVATYIKVFSGWWTKPNFINPAAGINRDGSARIAIDTGGSDQLATDIVSFLIPSGCTPPAVDGGGLPALSCAVASFHVTRTASSICGVILDNQWNPIAGARISAPVLGATTSAPDGKYCFYNVTSSRSFTLTVSYPNYFFPSSPAVTVITAGNQTVNFIGGPTVNLSVTTSPNPGQTGTNITETIVASNAGPGPASAVTITAAIPASFTLVSASTTRGDCNTATRSVTCNLGALPQTGQATITIIIKPTAPGLFGLVTSISGSNPDSNSSNNTATVTAAISATPPFGFESGSLAPWNIFGDVSARVTSTVAHTGTFSLQEAGGSGGVFLDLTGLTPGQVYRVTAKARSAPGTAGQAALWVNDTVGQGAVGDSWRTPSSSQWDTFSTTFFPDATGGMRIHLMFNGGSGTVYWDDISTSP
jgi:uncharacterized repeat protein (TIGR01451 family)